MNPVQDHRVTKKVLRILHGTKSATPTLAIPTFLPFGLLYFLNEKQSQLHRIVRGGGTEGDDDPSAGPLHGNPNMAPVVSVADFINFVVGGLIVEAERVDEMCIQLRKQLVLLKQDIDTLDMDIKTNRRTLTSGVQQTLAIHYNQPLLTRVHHSLQNDESVQKLQAYLAELQEKKALHSRIKMHHKASVRVQRILHGAKDAKPHLYALPQDSATDLIADMSILLSIRKAQHYIRDAVYDVREHEGSGLAAVSSLMEFLDYVDWGLSAALDDLEASEVQLKRTLRLKSSEDVLTELDRMDLDNKQMSCAALKHNQSVNSPHGPLPTPLKSSPPVSQHMHPTGLAQTQTPVATSASPASTFQPVAGGFVYTPPTFLSGNHRESLTRTSDQFLDAMCA